VLGNSAVVITKNDIGGTPTGVPSPGVWDGSLWTLLWEVLCYVAVAGLGVVGLLRRRWCIPGFLALALTWSALLPPWGVFADLVESQRSIDPSAAVLLVQTVAARFSVMFFAGALIYQYRNVIPARWSLVWLSLLVVLASSLLPNYRLIGAVPLAYAIIVSGSLVRNKYLGLRTDLSYGVYIYAWPMQQLLVICGLAFLNPFVFAIVSAAATLPLAALSWFLVEKPSLAFKSRLTNRGRAAVAEPRSS
jgi:peptidoglycan/LPS O-acetylase OafA/YrhL